MPSVLCLLPTLLAPPQGSSRAIDVSSLKVGPPTIVTELDLGSSKASFGSSRGRPTTLGFTCRPPSRRTAARRSRSTMWLTWPAER